MAGTPGAFERNRSGAAKLAEIRVLRHGRLSGPRGAALGGSNVGVFASAGKEKREGEEVRKAGPSARVAIDRRPGPQRGRPGARAVVPADERSRLHRRRTPGPLLLLALADRKLLQAAQKPRPAIGTLATTNRPGDRAAAARRRDGLRDGLATGSRPIPRRRRTETAVGAAERPSNETQKARHHARLARRVVDVAVDPRSAQTVSRASSSPTRATTSVSTHRVE